MEWTASTDYITPTLSSQSQLNHALAEALIDQMEWEYTVIHEALDSMQPVQEAPDANGQKKRNVFMAIWEFIQNMFTTFVQKARQLTGANKAWLDKHFKSLDNLDYSKLNIEMLPYWTQDMAKVTAEVNKTVLNVKRTITGPSKDSYGSKDELQELLFKGMTDENNNFANGVKNHFRAGSAKGPLKRVKLTGNEMKKVVLDEMRVFASGYEKTVIPAVKTQIDSIGQTLKQLANQSTTTTESFCILENAYMADVLPWNLPLFEAEEPAKPNTTQNGSQPKESPTKVEVTDKSDNKPASAGGSKEESTDSTVWKKNALQLTQVYLAAVMTVEEEKYHAYFSALRQLVSAGKKAGNAPTEPEAKPEEAKVNTK